MKRSLQEAGRAVEARYAVLFFNERSLGPGDRTEKSYDEILRLLERLNVPPAGLANRRSAGIMENVEEPPHSEVVDGLIERGATLCIGLIPSSLTFVEMCSSQNRPGLQRTAGTDPLPTCYYAPDINSSRDRTISSRARSHRKFSREDNRGLYG